MTGHIARAPGNIDDEGERKEDKKSKIDIRGEKRKKEVLQEFTLRELTASMYTQRTRTQFVI